MNTFLYLKYRRYGVIRTRYFDLRSGIASFILFALAGVPSVAAQETDIIVTDRPGFSSSPVSLPPSTLQVESGYQYTRHDSDSSEQTLPYALIRYGLSDHIEMQINWAGKTWADNNGSSVQGYNDASIGLKWQVSDSASRVPLAFFAGLSLPVGDSAFSSDEIDPTLGVFWTFSYGLDWFGTVLLSESDDDLTLGNGLGISIPVSDSVGAYVEYFGNYQDGQGPQNSINGGVTYLPRNNMQLDVFVGSGLNDRADDFIAGGGFSYRF